MIKETKSTRWSANAWRDPTTEMTTSERINEALFELAIAGTLLRKAESERDHFKTKLKETMAELEEVKLELDEVTEELERACNSTTERIQEQYVASLVKAERDRLKAERDALADKVSLAVMDLSVIKSDARLIIDYLRDEAPVLLLDLRDKAEAAYSRLRQGGSR